MNLIVGDQVSNGITTYTILKVNINERYYHVITHYLTTAKLKFDTVDNRYIYCGHINLDKSLDFITNDFSCCNKNNGYNKPMTVSDLLNKTDVSSGGLIIELYYPSCGFKVTIGHNYINRNATLYRKFIDAYGDMIVDEVTIKVIDNYAVLSIRLL